MTEITSAGRQLAADLANAEGCKIPYFADDFVGERSNSLKRALARLATQSIARDAELAEAKADLRAIDRQLIDHAAMVTNSSWLERSRALAAKHRETDPLVEVLMSIVPDIDCGAGESPAEAVARQLRAELAKHGIELTTNPSGRGLNAAGELK